MDNLNQQNEAWYDKTWLVVLLCFCFFPVGLYALWKNNSIGKGWKIGVSVFFALCLIAGLTSKDDNKKADVQTASAAGESTTPELTQAQKDSIVKAERLAELEVRKNQTLTARDLTQHYIDNEVRADENFKDKTFYVEGTVDDIKKDIMGDIYVTLEGAEMFRSVQCYFDDKTTAAKLEKGMRVTFYGKCDGLMMNVLMRNCVLSENLKDIEASLK